eukprot:scaffold578849_cov15-Prasinocladus_malaysianus.AAC.1
MLRPGVSWQTSVDRTEDVRRRIVESFDSILDIWAGDIKPVSGGYSMRIDLTDKTPQMREPYRLSHAQKEYLTDWCKNLLDAEIIERAPLS